LSNFKQPRNNILEARAVTVFRQNVEMHSLFWFRDSELLIDFNNVKTYGKTEFFYDTSNAFFAIFVIVTGTYARLGGKLPTVLCNFSPAIVII
jgi:hypothetical protein